MKFNVLIVFCIICFVQVYSGSVFSDDIIVGIEAIIRNNITGVSDRFVRDFLLIIDKYEDSEFIIRTLSHYVVEVPAEKIKKNEKTSKIDLDGIRKYQSEFDEFLMQNGRKIEEAQSIQIDNLKVIRLILSKELSPDQYNGVTNLAYVIAYPKATTEEVEGALDYLYGTGNSELKDFVNDFPTPSATDCPEAYKRDSTVNDQLKSITGIKAEVLANITAIVEKFPCNDEFGVSNFLKSFLKIVDRLTFLASNIKSKVSACYIKKETDITNGLNCSLMPDGNSVCRYTSVEVEEKKLKHFELILSTRFADEDFRGLINFVKATVFDKTPLNEVQKSLEYVFTDVAPVDC